MLSSKSFRHLAATSFVVPFWPQWTELSLSWHIVSTNVAILNSGTFKTFLEKKSKFHRLLGSRVQLECTLVCTRARRALKGCRSVHAKELSVWDVGSTLTVFSLNYIVRLEVCRQLLFLIFFFLGLSWIMVLLAKQNDNEWIMIVWLCAVPRVKFYHHSLIKHWLNWWLCVCACNYVCVLSFK